MADLTKTVEIVFGGRDANVTKTIDTIKGGLGNLNQSVGDAARPFANLFDGIVKTEAALSALAVGGLVLAIRESGKFEEGFKTITSIVRAAPADYDALRESIVEYGKSSTQSYESINDAIYQAISTGVAYENSIQFVTDAEKLAVAGKTDLSSATVLLASTMNAYGASADQASKYSDTLFKTVELGKVELPELAASLAQVTGIAASAGVDFDTLAAAISATTAYGLPASQAITGIKAALSNLIKPTSEAEQTAKALGIQFDAAALQSKGFDGVLQDVYKATGGNIDVMAKLFGSMEAVNVVMSLGTDKQGLFKKALEEIPNAAGATQAAYDKMKDSISNSLQTLENNVKRTMILIGDEIAGGAGGILKGVQDILAGVGDAVKEGDFKPLFDFLNELADEVEGFLVGVAKALPGALRGLNFDGLINSLKALGGSVGKFFGDAFGNLDLTKPDDLRRAIQKVIDSLAGLQNVVRGALDGFSPFFTKIIDFAKELSNSDEAMQLFIGKIAGVGKGVAVFADALQVIGPALAVLSGSSMISSIANLIKMGNALPILGASFSSLGILGGAAIGGVAALAAKAGWEFGEAIRSWFPQIDAAAQKAIAWLDVAAKKIGLGGLFGVTPNWGPEQDRAFNAAVAKAKSRAKENPVDLAIKPLIPPADQKKAESQMALVAPPVKPVAVVPKVDDEKAKKEKEKLDRELALKVLDIEAKFDTEKIKAQASVAIKAMDLTAQIRIANSEQAIKTLEAIGDVGKSAAGIIGDLLGALDGASNLEKSSLMWKIDEQLRLQQDSAKLAMELTKVQIEIERAKLDRMRTGDFKITISADGLKPHLEAFMWEVLEATQVRATEEVAEFLQGIA